MNQTNKNIKFLFVLPWGLEYPGGVNQVVINLYDQLVADGKFEAEVFVNNWADKVIYSKKSDGRTINFFCLRNFFESDAFWLTKLKYCIFLPYELFCLIRFLKRRHISVVNIHFPGLFSLPFIILKALKIFKGKIAVSFHGLDVKLIRKTKGNERKLWHWYLEHVDLIVACSSQLKEDICQFNKNLEPKIKVVYNGINEARFLSEKDGHCGLPEELRGNPYILNIGTFEYKKGQDVLIRSFAKIHGQHPQYRLVMVGRPAEEYDNLKRMVRDLGLDEKVFMFKNIKHSQIHAFYEGADFFVLPSRSEGMPIVLFEAGIYHLPVIASNVDGIPEVIDHQRDGILVAPDDEQELTDRMDFFIRSSSSIKEHGEKLYKKITNDYSWGKAISQYINHLHEKEQSL